MNYKSPDNIYWLFSSSAQSIAAFVGFIATGFIFAHDRIDKQIEKDPTLSEICTEIKNKNYSKLKLLLELSGVSIITNLFIVFINGYDLGYWADYFRGLVTIINLWTIIDAIYFVIYLVNPNKIKKAVRKLISANEYILKTRLADALSRGEFLVKFIELEKLLLKLSHDLEIDLDTIVRRDNFMSVIEIIRGLYQREKITNEQYMNLEKVNYIKNLTSHGEIMGVEKKIGDLIDDLIADLKNVEFNNNKKI